MGVFDVFIRPPGQENDEEGCDQADDRAPDRWGGEGEAHEQGAHDKA